MTAVYYPQARAILTLALDDPSSTDLSAESHHIVAAVPRSLTVHRNKHSEPDTFECVFDLRDMPIDPQLIKGAQVELYLFSMAALDEQPRMLTREQAGPGDVQGGFVAFRDKFVGTTKPLIIGTVLDIEEDMSADGATVSLTGEDYTSILKARQWPPLANGRARPIPIGKRLDALVNDILAIADPTGALTVRVEGVAPEALPTPSRKGLGAAHGIPVAQDTNCMEVISKLCARQGYVAFVDGLHLVISTPRYLHIAHDPALRVMTWGRNIERASLRRHFGIEAAPSVVVLYRDKTTGRMAEAEWPQGGRAKAKHGKAKSVERNFAKPKAKQPRTPAKTTTAEFITTTIYDSVSADEALAAAQAFYVRTCKSEREATVVTRELRDSNGASMFTLAPGDAIVLDVDTFNRAMFQDPTLTDGERLDRLLAAGFNHQVANLVVRNFARLDAFAAPLRVADVTFTYDLDSGVSIEMRLQDFIAADGVTHQTQNERANRAILDGDNRTMGAL